MPSGVPIATPRIGDNETADNRVQKAALGLGRRRVLGEDSQRKPGKTVPNQRKQNEQQEEEPESDGGVTEAEPNRVGRVCGNCKAP